MLVDNVTMKFDSSDVEFNSSAVEASVDVYDTKQFINVYKASFGTATSVEIGDETTYFTENNVT